MAPSPDTDGTRTDGFSPEIYLWTGKKSKKLKRGEWGGGGLENMRQEGAMRGRATGGTNQGRRR